MSSVDTPRSDPVIDDLLHTLERWTPLRDRLYDAEIRLFDKKRILERTARTTDDDLKADLEDKHARSLLIDQLIEQAPLASDVGHGSVAELKESLREILHAFRLAADANTATRLLRALPLWLEQELEKEPADPYRCRTLRDAFLVAELSWALGSASSATKDRDVVAAAVEAAASIAGVLIRHFGENPDFVGKDKDLDERLLVRMHLARMEWIKILLRFDEYGDLVADGGRELNFRLAQLVAPTGRRRLFASEPFPRIAPSIGLLKPSDEDREKKRLRKLHKRINEEEQQRFLDLAARLLLPRYLVEDAVGMLQALQSQSGGEDDEGNSIRYRIRKAVTGRAFPLLVATVSGVLMLLVASALALFGVLESRGAGVGMWVSVLADVPAVEATFGALRVGFLLLAAVWIITVMIALLSGGRAASYALLLRIPAATAFGLAILLALSFEWIGTQSGMGRLGPIVAILAAAGYAWIEVINQGGRSPRMPKQRLLAGRPKAKLTLLALGIATSVSALVLEVFGRALMTRVDGYPALRENPFVYLETLALLSSVSLAIGTFLQAIWDEQSITAPLSYLRLRG